MRIFHIALESEWRAARERGNYTTSTRGRTLSEEGFIHCSRRDQVAAVSRAAYADERRRLVLLEIETDRLTAPWREDPVDGDTFPHVYGPLTPAAVRSVTPWHRSGRERAFSEVFLVEILVRTGLAVLAMLLAFLGAALAPDETDGADLVGALAGLAVGATIFVAVLRRRG